MWGQKNKVQENVVVKGRSGTGMSAPYQQAVSNNVILAWVIVVQVLIIITLVIVWIVFPQKTVVTEFVRFGTNSDFQMLKVKDVFKDAKYKDVIIGSFLRDYVRYRTTKTNIYEADRNAMEKAYFMSGEEQRHKINALAEGKFSPLLKWAFERSVTFISDVVDSENLHYVNFKTIDKFENGKTVSAFWRATIKYEIGRGDINIDDSKRFNPIGLKVDQFVISAVSSETEE